MHLGCDRLLAYFVSRIAIIYNEQDNSEKFYQGHTSRITCMDVHPDSKSFC